MSKENFSFLQDLQTYPLLSLLTSKQQHAPTALFHNVDHLYSSPAILPSKQHSQCELGIPMLESLQPIK
jgi:hypothetical protein